MEDPLESEDSADDTFEVLDVSETSSSRNSQTNLLQKIAEKVASLSFKSPISQVAVGGLSGWVTGFLFKKVSKGAASSVGGAMVLFQIAHQSGYISINWRKVNKDVSIVQQRIDDHVDTSSRSLERVSSTMRTIVRSNVAVCVGFTGGFLIGMAS